MALKKQMFLKVDFSIFGIPKKKNNQDVTHGK